jgi:gamma-glutamylcyclotransferase (GGCT)/AIG2-like uncharacterized protein YtfP
MPLYFAYGSNMDRRAMAARCPASRAIGIARLPRHRFAMMREGYATLVRDPRCSVWGLVWDLGLADVAALDRYEGIGEGLYRKGQQSVVSGAGPRRVLVYFGRDAGAGRPKTGYMEGVVAAARDLDLPAAYLAELESFLPAALARYTRPAVESSRPRVRPTRGSPLEPVRDRNADWTWKP